MSTYLLFAALSLVANPIGCGSQPGSGGEEGGGAPSALPHRVRTVKVDELKRDLDAGKVAMLIDVRSPEEFAGGHVPSAVNIPLDQLDSRKSELDAHKADELYMICESGRRSFTASQKLARYGYRPVNVDGGTSAWRDAGLPTE